MTPDTGKTGRALSHRRFCDNRIHLLALPGRLLADLFRPAPAPAVLDWRALPILAYPHDKAAKTGERADAEGTIKKTGR